MIRNARQRIVSRSGVGKRTVLRSGKVNGGDYGGIGDRKLRTNDVGES
jgi:hypothetical protein